jgi:hypothetical protein
MAADEWLVVEGGHMVGLVGGRKVRGSGLLDRHLARSDWAAWTATGSDWAWALDQLALGSWVRHGGLAADVGIHQSGDGTFIIATDGNARTATWSPTRAGFDAEDWATVSITLPGE